MSQNIEFQVIRDPELWEEYIHTRDEANFLQSFWWGQFEAKLGKKFFPVLIRQGDQLVGAALVIKEEAKRGDYLAIAGGPLIDWHSSQAKQLFEAFSHYILQLAKDEGCVFVRIRPQVQNSSKVRQLVEEFDWQPAAMHLTADLTLQLDLTSELDEILKDMRKNTRYEVRKAKRESVETKIWTDPEKIEEFHRWQLYLADLHNFVPFSYDFLYEQFGMFVKHNHAALISSYHEDKLLASAFIIFYNQEAVYHYGISTPMGRRLPGSYAVQWAAIQEAKKRGCKTYNFWGIAPEDEPEHRFAGVSIFKRGFGGEEVEYLPAHDLAVSPAYLLTKGFELVRKKVRGL